MTFTYPHADYRAGLWEALELLQPIDFDKFVYFVAYNSFKSRK